MRKKLKWTGQAMYAGLVAAALAFGAASATEVRSSQCYFDPPTMLGECLTDHSCQRACEFYGGWQGECDQGCCFCAM